MGLLVNRLQVAGGSFSNLGNAMPWVRCFALSSVRSGYQGIVFGTGC